MEGRVIEKPWSISVIERDECWITAQVEDYRGAILGESTAPVTEGATFDVRAAVVRDAVENALRA